MHNKIADPRGLCIWREKSFILVTCRYCVCVCVTRLTSGFGGPYRCANPYFVLLTVNIIFSKNVF